MLVLVWLVRSRLVTLTPGPVVRTLLVPEEPWRHTNCLFVVVLAGNVAVQAMLKVL